MRGDRIEGNINFKNLTGIWSGQKEEDPICSAAILWTSNSETGSNPVSIRKEGSRYLLKSLVEEALMKISSETDFPMDAN